MRIVKLALLLPLAVLAVVLMLGFMVLVVSFTPPLVSTVALAVLAVIVAWFIFGRGRTAGPGSESSLLGGSKISKEGLL